MDAFIAGIVIVVVTALLVALVRGQATKPPSPGPRPGADDLLAGALLPDVVHDILGSAAEAFPDIDP